MDFASSYQNYADELAALSRVMRSQYHRLLAQGYRATFGDVEGELLYLLLRQLRPDVVFELSPDCGWSTNYILAALTANRSGIVHSFELASHKNGTPIEHVIRENLHSDWDQDRLRLHVGDARETTESIPGKIDFLFLDSCHEAFFSQWYVAKLFPRLNGIAFVQDIAFEDELEPSGEAAYLWDWIGSARPDVQLVGAVERTLREAGVRQDLAERRGLRCNSVFFEYPIRRQAERPRLSAGPRGLLQEAQDAAKLGDHHHADRLLNRVVRLILAEPSLVHRHRLLVQAAQLYRQLGEVAESDRCLQRALGVVVQADKFQRGKGLKELTRAYRKHQQWRLAGAAWCLRLFDATAALFPTRIAPAVPNKKTNTENSKLHPRAA